MKEDLKRRNCLAAVSILTLFVAFPARLLPQSALFEAFVLADRQALQR